MKRSEKLLLCSIWIRNIGEWVYFIALNIFVLQLTDSVFAVSILYMLPYIAGLTTYGWVGGIIDRVNQKYLLIALDLLVALLIFSIASTSSIWFIYCINFCIQLLNKMAETTSFVCMTNVVPQANQQKFNAWKNFVQSSGFMIGPSIAGLLFVIGGTYICDAPE